MNKLIKLATGFSFFLFVMASLLAPRATHAQTVPTECIGRELATYMNKVIGGTSGLSNIRLLSPVFNITNPAEVEIFDYMNQWGAQFGDLYGYAGNTYSHVPGAPEVRAMEWYERNFAGRFSGKPVVFTEYGDFNIGRTEPDDGSPGRSVLVTSMTNDFNEAALAGIAGVNYFNAFNLNPEFDFHALSDSEFIKITMSNPTKAGVNSAVFVQGGSLQTRVAQLARRWVVEIVQSRNEVDRAAASVNAYPDFTTNTVLRLCVGDSCDFENPDILIGFLRDLNGKVNRPVYVVAGPNEPATERWASKECVAPIEPPSLDYVPCGETTDPEFHSLRPYPASPCNQKQASFQDKDNEDIIMCGKDLVMREKFEVTKEDAYACEQVGTDADGWPIERCSFSVESTSELSFGLEGAALPIMGNTELVPNSTNPYPGGGSIIDFTTRMNEYASWYLNGVWPKAEENLSRLSLYDFDEILSLAGPIRKLLPREGQAEWRWQEVAAGALRSVRHNQIVACAPNLVRGLPSPCYTDGSPYTYRLNTYGNALGEKYYPIDHPSFHYVPMSSTEDRVGLVQLGNPRFTNNVTDLHFEAAVGSRNLYFPHMEEVTKLAQVLQQTYVPQGNDGLGGGPLDQLQKQQDAPYCEILETRSNPGDNLYGYLNNRGYPGPGEPENNVSGTLTYQAEFTCDFSPPKTDPLCMEMCANDPLKTPDICLEECTNDPTKCEVDILIPFDVDTTTPLADVVWDRMVAGYMGIFKRIFPLVGENSPLEKILDIPAESQIEYGSTNTAVGPGPNGGGVGGDDFLGNEPVGGDPENQAIGRGTLYFPHIGSVKEYFLDGIQGALKSYAFYEAEADPAVPTTCSVGTGYCSVENLMKYFGNDRIKATKASIICQKESGSNPYVANKTCTYGTDGIDNDNDGLIDDNDNWDNERFDGGTLDYSIGLFQINLLAHCPSSGPHYAKQPALYCTFDDEDAKDACETALLDPEENIRRAVSLSRNGTRWTPWSAAAVCGIN